MKNKNVILPECEGHELHTADIYRVKEKMPDIDFLYDISDFFKLFSDSTRLGILHALEGEELCVCDIAAVLGMTKSRVSHQLKLLRQGDLVRYKKVGKKVIYKLADKHIKDIIDITREHIKE